jgi:hypothetical protein
MTQDTKTGLMGDACAPIESVRGKRRTRADNIAPMISYRVVGDNNRKTLNL